MVSHLLSFSRKEWISLLSQFFIFIEHISIVDCKCKWIYFKCLLVPGKMARHMSIMEAGEWDQNYVGHACSPYR